QLLGRAEAAPGDRAEQGRLARADGFIDRRAMFEEQADGGAILVPDGGEQAVERRRAETQQMRGERQVPAPADREPERRRPPFALGEGRGLEAEAEIEQEVGETDAVGGIAVAERRTAAMMQPVATLLVRRLEQVRPRGQSVADLAPAVGADAFAQARLRNHRTDLAMRGGAAKQEAARSHGRPFTSVLRSETVDRA